MSTISPAAPPASRVEAPVTAVRVRHQVRDALMLAGFSVSASVACAGVFAAMSMWAR